MKKNTRPKIELKLSHFDNFLEIIGWISVVVIWALVLKKYSFLPESIPLHYNLMGHADRFGPKNSIWFLPILASILFIALTILNKYPHIFNYPKKVTTQNAFKLYTYATQLIRYMKFIIVFILGLVTYQIIENHNQLDPYFLPLTLALVFIPVAYYLFKTLKKDN